MRPVSDSDYRSLALFRYEIRKFLAFSEKAAREAGLEPQQHQLLLAVRGLPHELEPTIGTIAERLCIQHHSAVALVDKLEEKGFIVRSRSSQDKRVVLLELTDSGRKVLRVLSKKHRDRLGQVGPELVSALRRILGELSDE